MRNVRFLGFFFGITFCLQGCAVLLIGTAGVLGGMAISEDTVQSDIDADYERVWNTVLNEIEKMGAEILVDDEGDGLIEAKVRSSNVKIHVSRLTDKTARLKISARKNYIPNIKLAHEIAGRVLKKL